MITLQLDIYYLLYSGPRLIVLIINTVFGLYIIYKSRKIGVKLLFPLGMLIILIGSIDLFSGLYFFNIPLIHLRGIILNRTNKRRNIS